MIGSLGLSMPCDWFSGVVFALCLILGGVGHVLCFFFSGGVVYLGGLILHCFQIICTGMLFAVFLGTIWGTTKFLKFFILKQWRAKI